MMKSRRTFLGGVSATAVVSATGAASAQKKYDDGGGNGEIKIGHCGPYSGPASAYGVIGKSIEAYWNSVNDAGGVNGRRVKFLSLDDGYSPAKGVEAVRQLVEQEKVLALFQTLGTAVNTAIHKYMNQKKVPMLYIASGASKWGDPKHFPWTMGFQPDYHTEGTIYAKHALANVEDAKFAVLMQNDDYGKDYYAGLRAGLGKEAGRIVRMASYEVTDPTVESQMIELKDTGANVFFDIAAPKFAAQSIRKMAELGWKPAHYLNNVSASVGSVIKPAGFDNAQGIITAVYLKDPTDQKWEDDAEMKVWREWMTNYMPKANQGDANYVYAYAVSSLMHETLKKCGDTLTRENVMKQATNFQKLRLPLLLPGITINTSRTDYFPLQAVQLQRFKGESWELFGDILAAEST